MRELHVAKSISLSEQTYNKLRAYMISTKTTSLSEAITDIIIAMLPSPEEQGRIMEYMEWYNKQEFPDKLMSVNEAVHDLMRQGYVRMLTIKEKQEQ